jgi:hypothetical protein
LQGALVSSFEAEQHELPEKAGQIKAAHPNKNLFISSMQKGKGSKPHFRYRYKAETGSYIEASRKETFSVCPDKKTDGTWISEHSVSLNAENCVSVQAPNLAGTIRILFLENSGRMDTIQTLVEQSYIQMGDYSHMVWVLNDTLPQHCTGFNIICKKSDYGRYENKKYSQALIVDKTELTMGDAWYYSEMLGVEIPRNFIEPNYLPKGMIRIGPVMTFYPPNENFKTSMRPYLDHYLFSLEKLMNIRSKLEGLDAAYVPVSNENSRLTLDTSASGYRLPYKDEWGMLMRAGASTRYYWGAEEDSLTVSRYAWVRPFGYTQHKVAQKQPNAFGLYDMISPNNTVGADGDICPRNYPPNQIPECVFLIEKLAKIVEIQDNTGIPRIAMMDLKTGKEIKQTHTSYFGVASIRLLRKTPKLQKLEKF